MSRSGTTTSDRSRGGGSSRAEVRAPRRPPRPVRPGDRRRRLLVRAGVAVAVLGLLGWLLWGSPVLAVAAVRVDGAGTLTSAEVVDVAGVATGTPLLRVDVAAAEARVARLPQVADVEVTRGWPRSVVVTVVERVPVAVVEEAGGRSLVDRDGVLFDAVTGRPPAGAVPLDVADPGPDDRATRAALAALVALPGDVRADVAGARAPSPEDVRLTLADGTTVLWGSAEEAGEKAETLVALLGQLRAGALAPAGTIDVSTPSAVVLR
ncbi:FtsQ-type POTRA domain-containing protein [Geodermatophilus sp. DSM 44513]|uniref:cell division protein FtsQ/DivIB n=1 Tax=Geodermatophilus sp. DSM 44513 TaxID=1528104 RepID=UPI0028F70DF9|nr:FtsQ-type POTRA domain-containing protein [Geodermatophilus sp. DSM 44513]WNV77355.1 FtsQ-type POTRA domain-containing protein [Geodermatophilus sp. DSM 44513]